MTDYKGRILQFPSFGPIFKANITTSYSDSSTQTEDIVADVSQDTGIALPTADILGFVFDTATKYAVSMAVNSATPGDYETADGSQVHSVTAKWTNTVSGIEYIVTSIRLISVIFFNGGVYSLDGSLNTNQATLPFGIYDITEGTTRTTTVINE